MKWTVVDVEAERLPQGGAGLPRRRLGVTVSEQGRDQSRAASSAQENLMVTAASWAGKPSCWVKAVIEPLMRARARSSARATAVRFRKASAVMPPLTLAKPLVGSEAGQPMMKLAADTGVHWPTRISPASVSRASTPASSRTAIMHVLGGVGIGHLGGLVHVVDQDGAPVGPQGQGGVAPARFGQLGQLAGHLALGRRQQGLAVGHEQAGRVGPVLGLVQQVGRQQPGVGAVVGDDQALAGAEEHGRHRPVALHLDLGAGDGRATRADHFAHLGYRLGPKGQGGDTGRAVGPEDLVDAELLGHDQHGRVDYAAEPGTGGTTTAMLGHTGDDRGRAQLDQHRRVGSLTAGDEQTGAGDGRDLLAHREPGLAFEAPVPAGHELLVEAAHVVDAVADGASSSGRPSPSPRRTPPR